METKKAGIVHFDEIWDCHLNDCYNNLTFHLIRVSRHGYTEIRIVSVYIQIYVNKTIFYSSGFCASRKFISEACYIIRPWS